MKKTILKNIMKPWALNDEEILGLHRGDRIVILGEWFFAELKSPEGKFSAGDFYLASTKIYVMEVFMAFYKGLILQPPSGTLISGEFWITGDALKNFTIMKII